LARHRRSCVSRGLTEEGAGLWSADGRLLPKARQLCTVVPLDEAMTG
jgi:hypothetical protein